MSALSGRQVCDEATARALTEQIAQTAEMLLSLVIEAHDRGAWKALGYDSWEAYAVRELNAEQIKLPAADRKRAVELLDAAGMSAREIAPVLGVGHATVSRDLAPPPAPATASSEAPKPVEGEAVTEPECRDAIGAADPCKSPPAVSSETPAESAELPIPAEFHDAGQPVRLAEEVREPTQLDREATRIADAASLSGDLRRAVEQAEAAGPWAPESVMGRELHEYAHRLLACIADVGSAPA